MRQWRIDSVVELDDGEYVIVGVEGGNIKLRSTLDNRYSVIHHSELALRVQGVPDKDNVPDLTIDRSQYEDDPKIAVLVPHLQEMVFGTPIPPETQTRSEYDPKSITQSNRIEQKRQELARLGISLSAMTLRRKGAKFAKFGAAGLVDGRTIHHSVPLAHVDPRIRDALAEVINEETNKSTGTHNRLMLRVEAKIAQRNPGVVVKMPSKSSLSRWRQELTQGKHTLGRSTSRRSAANSPKRMHQSRPASKPGQEVQTDSSPFDFLVVGPDGKLQRVSLTILCDKATHSILATGVNLIAAKGVDHALLLARCLVPRELRPGGGYFLDAELPSMPWADLLGLDERDRFDTSRPFIKPERILIDNGADFLSAVFRSACRQHGISITESSLSTPTDKSMVERAFSTIETKFGQFVPGYLGSEVSKRGKKPEADENILDVFTLAELFDRWVDVVWQNMRTDALRDPFDPRITHSPNSMYSAMFEMTGFVYAPLTRDDYIALLPIVHRKILSDGIQIFYRRYDAPQLQPYRYRNTSDRKNKGKWAIKYDPYNPSAVWVANPDTGEWIECKWMNNDAFAKPFSRKVRSDARQISKAMGTLGDDEAMRATMELLAHSTSATQQRQSDESRMFYANSRPERDGLRLDPPEPAKSGEMPDPLADPSAGDVDYIEIEPFDPDKKVL